ncbi:probable endoribonuclease YicC, partial [Ruditapes philippinarum]|uniref:probable endoribonuclease YicC n=1 Tax=Ruditapes philippinarum TaxID=129788 RepID=UPI00295AC984
MYSYCESLLAQLAAVESANKGRTEKIKTKIKEKIAEHFDKVGLDENRLEQEVLFYSEKIDISEEQVRLKIHLDFLKNELNNSTSSGKKLNFITQEIGREINTIGSKANDAKIQQHVVTMKEDLEKLKEQLNNI